MRKLFEDIIKQEHKNNEGCWSCEHSTTAFFSLYCQKYNKYRTSFDGYDCEDYKQRVKVCFGV
jgi:hypothetical protein